MKQPEMRNEREMKLLMEAIEQLSNYRKQLHRYSDTTTNERNYKKLEHRTHIGIEKHTDRKTESLYLARYINKMENITTTEVNRNL